MASRYFQINNHARVVEIGEFEYKFQKLGPNHASGGFNGFLEIQNEEAAEVLAKNATKFGVWEITEAAAILEVQKKRSSINKIEHQSGQTRRNVKPAEAAKSEPAPSVDSVDDLMSGPEPTEALAAPDTAEAPAAKPKARKAKKSTAK